VLCDNTLVSAFALDRRRVDADIVMDVCRDFDFVPGADRSAGEGAFDARPTPFPSRPGPTAVLSGAGGGEEGDEEQSAFLAGGATRAVGGSLGKAGPSDFLTLVRRRRRFSFFS
jgi:hypothetical protein